MTEYQIRTDRHGRSERIAIPDGTEVAAVAALGARLAEGAATLKKAEARARRAHEDRRRFDDESKREVHTAALAGAASPSKKLVKKLRAVEDEVVEADLEHEGAIGVAAALKREVLAALVHNAPALRAEAVAHLDADVRQLATAHASLLKVAALYAEHAGVLALLERLRVGKAPVMGLLPGDGAQANFAISTALAQLKAAVYHATMFMEQRKVAPLPQAAEVADDESQAVEADDEGESDDLGDSMTIDDEPDDDDGDDE